MAYRFTRMCLLRNYQAGFQKQKAFPNIEDIYTEFRGWQALLQKPRKLWLAGGGNEEHLAFEDQVRVADGWICLSDARPAGGMAKIGLSDGGQSVALFHGDLRRSPH